MRLPKKLAAPLTLLAMACAMAPSAQAAPEVLNRIVVVINDGVVLQSELDAAMNDARTQIRSRNIAVPPDEVLRSQVLERLVLTRLQTQRAMQTGIRVDDRELNEVLQNLAKQNGMTLAQLADSIRADGLDFLAVREQFRDEVLMARLKSREVESRVLVTDQDIDLFLANQGPNGNVEYRLSHILVSIPDGASSQERDARRNKAEELLKRIKGGEDFAQVAISSSDGQQALQGGDLDWRKADDLPALFANVATKLKEGETSNVLETSSGFHLIRLQGTRGGEERQSVTETHAQHILLLANALRTDDQARVQARDLYDRVQKGENFEKLAKEFSDDPGSKNSGGDLGWQPPGVFAPDFQIRLDQLQPGEVSTPFHTQFGWHVAKVLERRTRDVTDESKRARARQAITQRKAAEDYDVWLRRLRAEAYIEYRLGTKPPADAAPAESGKS